MATTYPDGGPELAAGLRHLLEAKDCFVRAALTQHWKWNSGPMVAGEVRTGQWVGPEKPAPTEG